MTDGNIQVTLRQNEYLLALDDGPMGTRDLVLLFEVTATSVGRIIHKLRDLGLVSSSVGHAPQHRLMRSYPELVADGLVVGRRKLRCNIPDDEVEYVAKLRKDGLVGQRLIDQYLVRFPGGSGGGVRYRVNKAREQGLF